MMPDPTERRFMTHVYTITQTDIDSQGYRGRMESAERRWGLAVRRLVGRYAQSDLGRRVYRGANGALVLAGSSPYAPDIR